MSLYSLNEICKGCIFATFIEGPNGEDIFWGCHIKNEDNTNGYNGTCDEKDTGKTTL